ncbi:MAG TPA: hypothetical protein PKH69_03275 [Thiobacillaceae bacterium]|nr:hypothetical protein [Thiobacillaceae bacterium]HNU63110.1 hypothetical protein [Thiobacillaceae bacterium]
MPSIRGADSYNENLFTTVHLEEFMEQGDRPIRQVMVHGLTRVDQLLTLTMAAYNLTRLLNLMQPQGRLARSMPASR